MRSETTSIVSICIIIFLTAIVFAQYEYNKSLKRILDEQPVKHIYVPLYTGCADVDDICITESVELPDDFFNDCE